jgi:predicted O-linked N-acetylglucosamine transferase (SPINDLY family)
MSPKKNKTKKGSCSLSSGTQQGKGKQSHESSQLSAEEYYSLGNSFYAHGKLSEAISCYEKVVQIRPDLAEAYYNMGNAFGDQGKVDEAISCFEKAVCLKPHDGEAYYNMGNIFQAQGKLSEAMSCYEKAVQIRPDLAEAYYNMGNAFGDQDKLSEAISCYEKVLKLKPGFSDAYNNMGNALKEQGRLHEAIFCYQEALQLSPHDADAYCNMGNAYGEGRKFAEAISCYNKALQLKPNLAYAYNNMGNALRSQGKLAEAMSCYEKALELKPDAGIEIKSLLMLPAICESKESIEHYRRKITEQIELLTDKELTLEDPRTQVGLTNFCLAYHGLNDKEIQEKLASFYIHACPDLTWTSYNCKNQQRISDKIRIGIVSKYLSDHTIGKLNYGIIRNLSREKFHVKLFRLPGKEDDLAKAINSEVDQVVFLPTSLAIARQKISECSLDILFYLDIGMEPFTYFLAFSRLAPVQCVTWGHPVTTGIPNMDYFISSENAEPPGAQEHYSERLVLLKRLGTCYYRPELPKELPLREKFDLPDDYNLYVCPQSLFKFHPDFDGILGDILRQDPRGLLVLIGGEPAYWIKLLSDRFARTFPDAIDRVRFLPKMSRKDFLCLLKLADVLLDTPHFCGGNTSLESFACGVPVVTLPGSFLRGRLTLAFYRQMGVMDCVADDAQSYVNIALRLANDKRWRDEVKEKIEARADVLFEDIEVVRELEHFFERAVQEARRRSQISIS